MMISYIPFEPTDLEQIVKFVAHLQDEERQIVSDLKCGDEIAVDYANSLVSAVKEHDGVIIVAKAGHETIGFVCAWHDIDDDPLLHEDAQHHGYISDLFVAASWRRQGVARKLLLAVEAIFRRDGCRRMRVHAKGGNDLAHWCYASMDYRPYEIIFEKQF